MPARIPRAPAVLHVCPVTQLFVMRVARKRAHTVWGAMAMVRAVKRVRVGLRVLQLLGSQRTMRASIMSWFRRAASLVAPQDGGEKAGVVALAAAEATLRSDLKPGPDSSRRAVLRKAAAAGSQVPSSSSSSSRAALRSGSAPGAPASSDSAAGQLPQAAAPPAAPGGAEGSTDGRAGAPAAAPATSSAAAAGGPAASRSSGSSSRRRRRDARRGRVVAAAAARGVGAADVTRGRALAAAARLSAPDPALAALWQAAGTSSAE